MAGRWSLKCATWLLSTFGSGPTVEALAGDLSEDYLRGRSAAWLWRQVLTAVVVSFWSELRAHPVLALRAVTLGSMVFNVAMFACWPLLSSLDGLWSGTPLAGHLQLRLLSYSLMVAGLTFCAALVAGWTVARLHRQHRTMSIGSALVVAMAFWVLDPEVYRLIANAITHERYVPYLLVHLVHRVAVVFGLVIGGLALPVGTTIARNAATCQ